MATVYPRRNVLRILTSLQHSYKNLFGRYLLATNLTISLCLSGVGDLLQQQYDIATSQLQKVDTTRTRNMCASGVTVGFLCHYWYKWLDQRFPGRTIAIVLKKVVIDQIFLSPVLICVFFGTVGYLEGSTRQQVKTEILEKGHQLYLAEWFVWPVAQYVNFTLLPTRYRVLYDNTISLGFDVYTSYIKHKTGKQTHETEVHAKNSSQPQPLLATCESFNTSEKCIGST